MLRHCLAMLALASPMALPAQFFDRDAVVDGAIDVAGELVAYTMREADVAGDRFVMRVHTVAARGGTPAVVGSGFAPAFAPVGAALARLADSGGRTRLLVRDGASSVDRELGGDHTDITAFRWSPDGRRIAFAATPVVSLGRAELSPGLPGERQSLYVVDITDGTPARLTGDDFALGPAEPELDGLIEFDWLDNHRIVASGRQDGSAEHPGGASLFIIDADDGNRRYLAGAGGRWHLPRVSPDGDWIAFTGQALGSAGWMASELIVLRPDGTGLKRLTVGLDHDALDVAWGNDSRTVWFATEDRGSRNIQRVDSRNGRPGVGTSGTHILSLEAVAARGNWALAVRRTAHSPGTLVRFPLDKPHELLVMIEAQMAGFEGEIEELDIPVAGNTLHGWLIRPPGFSTERRWPLVVSLHGGPHAMAGAGYAPNALALANSGALVLRLNPRGSTGFGYDIANGLAGRWPDSDIADARAAIDMLVERALADSTRVSVIGFGAGAVSAAALRQADDRIDSAVLYCAGGDWLAGSSKPDLPMWSEWYAARPWLVEPSRWWERAGLALRGDSDAPVMVVASNQPGLVDFGLLHASELARPGVSRATIVTDGVCSDLGPGTQARILGQVSDWLLQGAGTGASGPPAGSN